MASDLGEFQIHVPPVMRFFERPLFDGARRREHYVFADARAPLDITSNSEVEFRIPASTNEHIDLKQTYLEIEASFDKIENGIKVGFNPGFFEPLGESGEESSGDGGEEQMTTDKEEEEYDIYKHLKPEAYYKTLFPNFRSTYLAKNADFITPIDSFIHTMWRTVVVKANGVPIYNSNNDQPYRSYINSRLRTEDRDMKMKAYTSLYTRNDGKTLRNQPNPWIAENPGAILRNERIRRRNKIQLADLIHCDFWENATHLLMNGVALDIKLVPASDKFRFQISKDLQEKYRFKIETIQLKVEYITINPDTLQGIEAGLQTSPAIYPFPRTECKILPLHKGIKEYRLPEIFDKQIPVDIVIAMVDRDNFTGDFALDPFYFKRNQIESAAFYLDNVSIPGEPYFFEPENPEDDNINRRGTDECLMHPLRELHRVAGTPYNGFDQNSLGDGNFFICFKTDPTVPADLSIWGSPKSGNTSLCLRFHEPIPSEQELIILARFPALMQIDKNRRVIVK
jgi:hypothetical protein